MSIKVYVLRSLSSAYRYVGITNNLRRRFEQHNLGYNKSTKAYIPFKLLLEESYESYGDARYREKFLKSGQGRKYLDSIEK